MKHVVSSLYADYGRYIDEFRALPKALDCLKPVERRLLLTVHLEARKKLVKSAKIVGACIGSYHPHGDCLNKDVGILTLDGNIRSIEDVYLSNISHIEVLGTDSCGNTIPVIAHSFRIGQYATKIYNIKLLDGSNIKTTNNHQFNTLNRGWVSAENLKDDDILVAIRATKKQGYIHLNSLNYDKTLHNLVYEFYNGKTSNVVHHKDKNTCNNLPENLEELSRSNHAKLHNNENNLDGLSKGRESMFSENGKYRDQIKDKNQKLMSLYNTKLPIIKAIKVLRELQNRNVELTIDNYILYRDDVGVYNAPFIHTILENKYVNSFEELVSIIDTFKLDTSSIKKSNKKNIKSNKKHNIDNFNNLSSDECKKLSRVIIKMKYKFGIIDYSYYNICKNEVLEDIDSFYDTYPDIDKLKNINGNLKELVKTINISSQIIDSIVIEELDTPEPMYDFTVDEHENMFIVGNVFNNGVSLVNIHNSSTYESLVSLVRRGFVEGQGNWGNYGLEDASQAAYRYTECKANNNLNDIFSDYLKFVPWEEVEMESEPLYIPFPVPLGLVGSGITTGIGFNITRIPRYSLKDLVTRLVQLLENVKPDTIIPSVTDCTLYEDSPNQFESILTTGLGRIQIVPNSIITSTKMTIIGRNPLVGFKALKKFNNEYEEKNNNPFFVAVDLWKFTSKHSIEIQITAATRSKLLTKDFTTTILKLISSITNIKVNVIENSIVKVKSIDTLLLECYEKWKLSKTQYYQNQLGYNLEKLNEFKIINEIRTIIQNNPTIKMIDDIVKLNTSSYSEAEIRSVCSKHNIKTLIESHIDITGLQNKIKILQKTISDIDNVSLLELKSKFLK